MKDICALADISGFVASNRGTIYVEHKDGSFWETTRVEIRGDRVFAVYHLGSVEKSEIDN
ncbi:hypothetical protein [Mucilaginibacter pedocola]|uniref:hypothetical protein n=1 Tax=Mucilaginibacter pedocola TaxID=1792845 RepID=UPI0011809F2D|nr:hypothetical protein [Mucilaginibacter pedocola]